MAAATGMSRTTIRAGLEENSLPRKRQARHRVPGAYGVAARADRARPKLGAGTGAAGRSGDARRSDGTVAVDLQQRGAVGRQLQTQGHRVSERTVIRLLHELGYSLQAIRKTLEGNRHADRDAQFKARDERMSRLL